MGCNILHILENGYIFPMPFIPSTFRKGTKTQKGKRENKMMKKKIPRERKG